ncbi:hypothetical protein ScPMuIL_018855 [Solemya velum]
MASTVSTIATGVDTILAPASRKETIDERLRQFTKFLFDPNEFTVFGRSLRAWAETILFKTVFLVCVIGFLAGMCAILYEILDWNYPSLIGADSILRGNPGLGFRPMPDVGTTLIRFEKSDPTTYTMHIDNIESYLQYYENQNQVTETGTIIDCDGDGYKEGRPKDEWDKACRFDITTQLGADCVKQQAFGFEDGQPCILLKINKIFAWMPEEYTNETVPDSIRGHWSQYFVTVDCYGENDSDKDNMGALTYYPSMGFHYKYFPFRNQQGYRSPLVFVRFENPTPGVLLMVACKIHAKNIYHNYMEKAGMVHFELLVD